MPVVRVIRREARVQPPTPTPAAPLTDPLEVLTPAEMRRQLRLPADTGDGDPYAGLVSAAIRSGVAFVARNTTVPILDIAEVCQVPIVSPNAYLEIPATYVKSVMRVRYWREGEGYRENPTGEVLAANLGRVVLQEDRSFVYPPTDGWPMRRAGSPLLADVMRGATVDEDNVLWQACVVAARLFFQGYEEIPPLHAVWSLMQTAAP